MKKKIISLLLCLAMISVSAPVIAENTVVAKVGNTEYTNYEQAWEYVQANGGTIDVLSDWVMDKNLTVPEGKKITVNMNGHNIRRNFAPGTAAGSGQIFLVCDNAELIVNGGTETTEHKGTISPEGLWINDETGTNSLYGGLISGGANGDGGGGIHIQENAKVTLNDVTVAGNRSQDDKGAGGVRLQYDNSRLVLNNSRICYNLADAGDGGGIYVNGDAAVVSITNNSSVDNNATTDSESDGGGIYIYDGSVVVDGTSQISYNKSTQRGGGIFLYDGSLTLEDGSILTGNVTKMEGGALYIDDWYDNTAKISADFIGNRAEEEEGGAIYINDEADILVENAKFVRNSAKTKGGAIYVDTDDCFSLAGKCEIYENMPNNLYLTNKKNLASAKMSEGSRVGIFTEWDATADNNPVETTYNDVAHFVSDKNNQKVAGEEGKLYYVDAPDDGDTTVPDKYIVNGVEYELKNGTFTYNSDLGGNLEAKYFYTDGYFAESPTVYNEHMATTSVNLTMASSASELGEREYTQEIASENLTKFMRDLGYSEMQINYTKPAYYGDNASPLSTIGYVISSKKVNLNDSEHTIVSMTVRSAEYADEWASNVTLGDGTGEAEGFSDAATQVFEAIQNYLDDKNIDTNTVKFWITGYSRGGATANIVSKRLTDIYGGEKVYGYTFEAPRGGVKTEIKLGESYLNIHNIINKADLVTYVGPVEMGFVRYGHDVYVPGYSVGTPQYEEQKEKMLSQLARLDREFEFDDYFRQATVEYFWGTVGYYDSFIVERSSPDFKTAEEWIPFFLEQFQMRSLTDEVNNSEYNRLSPTWKGFRHYYSDHKWYMKSTDEGIKEIVSVGVEPEAYEKALTFEQSLANVMQLYYSLPSDRKNEFMNCFDVDAIKSKIDMLHMWTFVIDEWDDLSYTDRNKEIKDLWNAIGIEGVSNSVLTNDEKEVLRTALPVILDVLLDLVSEDYDHNDQDCIGTLAHNISNIFLSHYFAVTCSWLRSYDSFYEADCAVVPEAPEINLESGIYKSGTVIKINQKSNTTYSYTLNGELNFYNSEAGIVLSVDEENSVKQYTLKVIAVKDGVQSEVSTFTFIVSDEPVVTFEKDLFKIDNLDEEAVFVVAGYCGNKLNDVKMIPLSQNSKITLEETNLNTSGCDYIKAFLWKDLQALSPLCKNIEIRINEGE